MKEIEDLACCMDKSKRMSVCSSEVCTLSEKKAALKAMETLAEDTRRASPIPFSKGDVVSEAFSLTTQEAVKKSEDIKTSEEGNVQITRKTKVEEQFQRTKKMYAAEISTSSQSSVQFRAASPEMEQIMERKQMYQSYQQDSSRLTPNMSMMQHKIAQSERCLTPEIENLIGKPHGSWSPMPPACFVRPFSPNQTISFPPDIPPIPGTAPPPPRTHTPEQFQEARETVERFVDHVTQQAQAVTMGRSAQSYTQQAVFTSQTQQVSGQQYTPRYDSTQGFSAYVGKGSSGSQNNGNPGNPHNSGDHGNGQCENQGNENGNRNAGNVNPANGNPGNHGNENVVNGNPENPKNHGNGNPGNGNSDDDGKEKPTVTEPDDDEADEKYSRKSSKTDQSQKSSRKTSSVSEEESSRRVFTDFGGPQIQSEVEVESITEGGVQTTSVRKSQKTEYSSCQFESARQSSIKQGSDYKTESENNQEKKSEEPRKYSQPKFTAEESSTNEEETVTKSQVEEIIKQELNKVFQMVQAMQNTNFGERYDQKAEHHSKRSERKAIQTVDQSFKRTVEEQSSASAYTGEYITQTGKLTSDLTIAPARSFTPQPLENNYPLSYQSMPSDAPQPRSYPEPPKTSDKSGYIPLTGVDRSSPFLQALTIAPDRPYSPLPAATVAETLTFITSSQKGSSSMLEALTTAPSTPFQIKGASSEYESAQKYSPKPAQGEFKPISVESKPANYVTSTQTIDNFSISSIPPLVNEQKSAFKRTSEVKSSTVGESQRQQETQSMLKSAHLQTSIATKTERPLTPSGLHPPEYLPYYQRDIGEIPLAHRANSPVPHQIKAPSLDPPRAQSVPRQSERRGSVKAMSEAYTQQVINCQQHSTQGTSSVSYVSSGAFSTASVTKAYSYEQEHKSIDPTGYHASPLAGKLPLAGEQTLPKCSSPVLGKLDHTKQVFKPTVPTQQPSSSFRSPITEQANLRQAPPYFVQEKDKPQVPWVVVKEDELAASASKPTLPKLPGVKPTLPTFPLVNKSSPSIPPVTAPPSAPSDAGPGGAKSSSTAGTSAPRRGRGVLNAAVVGGRIPLCGSCNSQIRGPFITALGKIWCPEHFVCVNANCRRPLQDIGFVEEAQGLYCEFCFEQYLAPTCSKCNAKVKGDCLNAIGKHFHPDCFTCAYCGKLFGNSPFFLEDALPYCEADWNELFTTKCFSCGFPIEAGDRWVEALNNNYHSQCFNCTMCKKNLEGQSFFAKGGRPFCKNHAR